MQQQGAPLHIHFLLLLLSSLQGLRVLLEKDIPNVKAATSDEPKELDDEQGSEHNDPRKHFEVVNLLLQVVGDETQERYDTYQKVERGEERGSERR